MTRNEMCRVFLDVSHYFWKSEKSIKESKIARVRESTIKREQIRSYSEALINHDRLFDKLDEKVI